MKKRFSFLFFPVITLLLETLPYGAVCVFANPEGKSFRQTYSYFDLTPFGYANFFPFLTALITLTVLVLLTVYCVTEKKAIIKITGAFLIFGIFLSLCPLLYGVRFFSVTGALITLSLILELVFIIITVKST